MCQYVIWYTAAHRLSRTAGIHEREKLTRPRMSLPQRYSISEDSSYFRYNFDLRRNSKSVFQLPWFSHCFQVSSSGCSHSRGHWLSLFVRHCHWSNSVNLFQALLIGPKIARLHQCAGQWRCKVYLKNGYLVVNVVEKHLQMNRIFNPKYNIVRIH